MSHVPLKRGNVPLFCTNADETLHWIYARNPNAMPESPQCELDLGTSVRLQRDTISGHSPVFWEAIYFRALYPSKQIL